MNGNWKISVSPVCHKEGKQFAYVSFQDGERIAEGTIPDCVITTAQDFTAEEITQMEDYMRRELTELKKAASSVNVWNAFLKK
ncbi:MAG: hypothetical protein J1E65_07695 [Lachnospiraceae bacterium]|nr:hypothetical protein [Lachnospiraceae bacterium]